MRAVLLSVPEDVILADTSQSIVDMACNMPDGAVAKSKFFDEELDAFIITVEHDSFDDVKDGAVQPIINAEFEQHLGKPLANPDKPIIGVGGEEVMAPPAHFREPDTGDSNISENTSMQCGSFPGEIDNGLAKHIEKSMDADEYKKIAKQVFQTNDHIGAEPEDSKTIANAIEHTDR